MAIFAQAFPPKEENSAEAGLAVHQARLRGSERRDSPGGRGLTSEFMMAARDVGGHRREGPSRIRR